ncbi:MAG TPA: universal stress protein, partial [Chloroflexota bacterium]
LVANGIAAESGVPFGGSAASWIVEESDIRRADLVIKATHDRIGPDRWVHGSVAEAVVSHSTVPVMLVRGSSAEHLALRFDTQNRLLLVPVDGSELAASALPVARDLAQQLGASIVLVAVVPRPGQLAAAESGVATQVGSEQARLEAEAWAYLEASVGQVGASNVNVTTTLRRGEPALEIAAAAEEYAAAATVMATHGRTGLVRSLVGSVAGAVLHHSSCPVVLHRPGVLRGAEQPIVRQPAIGVAGD